MPTGSPGVVPLAVREGRTELSLEDPNPDEIAVHVIGPDSLVTRNLEKHKKMTQI